MHYIVKKTSFYYTKDNYLNAMVVDSDVCEGMRKKTIIVIDSSFTKLGTLSKKKKLCSHATDAGGGGTGIGLAREMQGRNRMLLDDDYIFCAYSLPGHNITIQSLTKKFLGMGRISYRNYVQLVFTAYCLQQQFEISEFKMLQHKVNNTEYGELIDQPILTQWENASLAFDKYLKKELALLNYENL